MYETIFLIQDSDLKLYFWGPDLSHFKGVINYHIKFYRF